MAYLLYTRIQPPEVCNCMSKNQLGKEFIYQSFSISGPTQFFLNQSMHRATFVFKVQKAFDKLEFSRVNTSFYYDESNPVSKTKNVDKPEAVFLSEKYVSEDSAGYLIAADAFLSVKNGPGKASQFSRHASRSFF